MKCSWIYIKYLRKNSRAQHAQELVTSHSGVDSNLDVTPSCSCDKDGFSGTQRYKEHHADEGYHSFHQPGFKGTRISPIIWWKADATTLKTCNILFPSHHNKIKETDELTSTPFHFCICYICTTLNYIIYIYKKLLILGGGNFLIRFRFVLHTMQW